MKVRMKRFSVYFVEDILLDLYNGLPLADLEGDENVRVALDAIQDSVYVEDIFDETI